MPIFRGVALKKKRKMNKECSAVLTAKDFKYNNKLGKGRNGGREGEEEGYNQKKTQTDEGRKCKSAKTVHLSHTCSTEVKRETSRLTSVYGKMDYKARKQRKFLARATKFGASLNREYSSLFQNKGKFYVSQDKDPHSNSHFPCIMRLETVVR